MSQPMENLEAVEEYGADGRPRGKRAHRWLWMVLFAVLLLIGGLVAWRFRPLNSSEKRIVGTWRDELGNEVVFEPNRTLRQSASSAYTWSASGAVLRWRLAPGFPTSWAAARIYWDSVVEPDDWSTEVSFEIDDRGRLHLLPTKSGHGDEFWVRVR